MAVESQVQTSDRRKWWALGALCFGLFMALLDVTIVNVALPSIQTALNAPFSSLQWVVNAYALVFAVTLITASRMGDLFGRKRVFIMGMALFSLGSLLCSLAGTVSLFGLSHASTLDVFRGFQGIGAAAMMPLSLAILSTTFHGKERSVAIGIWGGVSGIATAIGPLVGGVLVQTVGWPSIFYLNVPIGAIGIALTLWAVTESRDESASRAIDLFGLFTLTVSLFCLVLGFMQANDPGKGWTSPYILALFVGAALFGVAFVIGELRIEHPMADPRLFKIPSFTGAAIAAFVLSAGTFSLLFFLTIYLQNYLGLSALGAGLRFLPMSALSFLMAPVAGMLAGRVGERAVLTTALVLLTAAAIWMRAIGFSTHHSAWMALLVPFIVAGVGVGLANPPISGLAVGTAPPHRVGMAAGLNSVCRQVGIAFGVAFFGSLLSRRYLGHVTHGISALNAAPGVKAEILKGVGQAGVMAGSSGFSGSSHPNPYATNPLFPSIQHIARHAFILGTREVFLAAAVILAAGTILCFWLIPSGALRHDGTPHR